MLASYPGPFKKSEKVGGWLPSVICDCYMKKQLHQLPFISYVHLPFGVLHLTLVLPCLQVLHLTLVLPCLRVLHLTLVLHCLRVLHLTLILPCLQVLCLPFSHTISHTMLSYQSSAILPHTSCISLLCRYSILILPFFHSPVPSIPTSQSKILLVWRVTVRQMVSVVLTFFSLLSGQRAWRTIPLLL